MKYVVAVKREARGQLKGTLAELLKNIPGVQCIVGDADATRLQVELTPEGYEGLQKASQGRLHIEPLILRQRLST